MTSADIDIELLDGLDEQATAVQSRIDRLETVQQDLGDLQDQWENELETEAKTAFATSALGLKSTVAAATDVSDYEAALEEIEQSLNAPLRDAVLKGMKNICVAVDIQLSNQAAEDIKPVLGSWNTDRLQNAVTIYSELADRLTEGPEPVATATKTYLNEQRQQRLLNETELDATVSNYFERHNELSDISEAIISAGDWAPSAFESLPQKEAYYGISDDGEVSQITTHVETIDEYLSNLETTRIPASNVANYSLNNAYIEDLSDLQSRLYSMAKDAETLDQKHDVVFTTAVFEDQDEITGQLVETPLGKIPECRQQLFNSNPDSLTELVQYLEALKREFETWSNQTAQQLEQLEQIASRVAEELPDAPTLALDADSLTAESLREDPANGLDAFGRFNEWRSELEAFIETENTDTASVVSYWLRIESGQSLSYTEIADVREDLAELVGDRLRVTVDSGDGE